MNRKGFTLVELLAVIAILALVLAIAIPTSIEAYKKAKLKTEDVFLKRLSEVIEDYVSMSSQELLDNNLVRSETLNPGAGKTIEKPKVDIGLQDTSEYKVYTMKKEGNIDVKVKDLIDNGLLFEAKYINPNNKNGTCSKDVKILIYKDTDAVYCHKIETSQLYDESKPDSENCLTKEYVDKYLTTNGNINTYAIDTCVWEIK